MAEIKKAKRVLFNFDFSKEGAAVHLVGPKQGNAANSYEILCTKSTDKLPDVSDSELVSVSKALEQVNVNLSMEEFLRRFFDMWHSDAELLTKLLGFETEYEAAKREREASGEEEWDYSKYLESKVSQFTIMKSMNDGSLENISKSALIDTLALQEKFETALESHTIKMKEEEMKDLEIAKAAQLKAESELASQLDIVKSLEAQVATLTEQLNVVKQAEVEAQLAAIRNEVKDVVAEDKLETIVKSLHAMDKEAAEAMIAVMKQAKQSAVKAQEDSDLFKEVGHGEETDIKKAADQAAIDFLSKQATL